MAPPRKSRHSVLQLGLGGSGALCSRFTRARLGANLRHIRGQSINQSIKQAITHLSITHSSLNKLINQSKVAKVCMLGVSKGISGFQREYCGWCPVRQHEGRVCCVSGVDSCQLSRTGLGLSFLDSVLVSWQGAHAFYQIL